MTTIVFLLTAAWHALAFWHFSFFPARTLALTTRERPVNPLATELFRFLGGLNLALVALGIASVWVAPGAQWAAALALMVANASQMLVDLRVRKMGLVHGAFFLQILVGDTLFTLANGAVLLRALLH